MVNSLLQCFGAFYDVHKGAHCIDPQLSVADPGEGPGEPSPPPPSFLDQTKARRAEKKFFWDGPPPFSQGLDGRPPPSSPYLKICIRHWLFLKSKLCYALHGLHLSLAAAVIVRDRECNSNGKHFKKTYQTIRKLQNKIIRIITFSKFTDHTSPSALFKELSILYL